MPVGKEAKIILIPSRLSSTRTHAAVCQGIGESSTSVTLYPPFVVECRISYECVGARFKCHVAVMSLVGQGGNQTATNISTTNSMQ